MQTALPLTHIRFALFLVLALAATLLVTTAPHVTGAHAAFTGQPLPAPQWQSAFDFRVGASFYDRMLDCPNSFTVDDPGDTADASAGDGLCADSSGKCTLRAAIQEANALTSCSPLTINFSVTGTISLATALPNLNHPNLTISGPGAASLTVQRSTASGTAEFRVFRINSGKVMAISGLTVSNGKLSGANSGSGILNAGTLSLTDCVVSGNTGAYFGGGIQSSASLTVTRCTISDNTATAGGGGIDALSTFVMSDSTVSGNTADKQGGGLELERVTATLTNCTISGNTANYGGGIHSLGTSGNSNLLTLDNCTITENTGGNGAGIRTNANAGAVSVATRLKNTLVANNTGNNFVTNGSDAVLSLEGNNLDSDGTSGFTNGANGNLVGTAASKLNALLSELGNYGGATQTHALLPGSPAINAGTSSGATYSDQRGSSRVGAVDIGAFESQGFTLMVSSGNNQSAMANTNFASPLAVAATASIASEPVNGGQVTFAPPASGASATLAGNPASIASGVAATATVKANALVGGPYIVAASANGAAAVNFSLTNACPTITVIAPATNSGTAGAGFNQTFTQTGGIGSTTFSTSSALPTGITLSNTGLLAGTANQTGSFPLVIKATDSNGCTGTVSYTLTMGCPAITVTAPATNSAILGVSFSQMFTQSGGSGTITFGTASSLPTGLTLSTGGALSGTPTQSGTFPIIVTATDSNGCTGTASYTLTVGCASSLTVNDLGDASDASVGDGVCADASGKCTLRAAIEEANALTSCSPLTINFSVTGTISLATALPNLNHPNLTISGPGAASLTVQRSPASGTPNFRIFSISSGKTVAISGLTIANGYVSTDGGGITNFGSLTITDCAIRDNYANGGGGIINVAILNMFNSTLSGNRAGFDGAGMYNINGTASLTNCTISANTSVGGGSGGIVSLAYSGFSASLLLTNCTVTGNSGSKIIDVFIYPGGIASTAQLRNTLVAGNSGKNFEFPGTTQVTSLGNNLDSDGTSGFINGANGNLVGTAARKINALLFPLGNYGGTTQTHALLPGSPAINAGTSSGAPTSDQRGSSRVGAVDIGAFESQGFTLMVSGGNNQSAMANTNFASPLAVTATANVASEPVNGGQVTFALPASGASATLAGNPASIASGVATTGTVKANALVGGPYIVAASANGAAAVNFSLTNTCPTITVIAPATNSGTAGIAFSQSFTQAGGIGTTTFNTASTLPAGLTLSTGGVLSGIPAQTGTFPITVKATDSNGCTNTAGYTLSIGCQTITVTAPATNGGTAGAGFSQTFTQTGGLGTIMWSKTGALPTGITLSTAGVLAGTPAQTGSFPITVTAIDSNGCIGTVNYTLTIGCQTITIGPASIAGGNSGVAYSQQFTQSDGIGTATFSTSSTLPTGITLSSGGLLSGLTTQTGTFPITVKATDSNGCMGTANYTLAVGCPNVTLSALPAGIAGTAYGQTLTASPAGGGYSFAVTSGSLPPGLSLSAGGAFTGTPTAAGTFDFTIRATGFGGCAGSQAYSLVINCPAIALSLVSLPNAAVNSPYSHTISAMPSGTAYSFSLTSGALPAGLTLNSSTGEISGSATQTGTFNFRVAAAGWGNCTGFRDYSLAVSCAAVTVNPSSLPGGSIGASYSQGVSALPAGTYTYTVSSGALPAGLMLNAATGAITGTPAASGSYNFTITASAGGCSGSRGYTLAIGCQTISFTTTSLPAGTTGSNYLQTLTVTPSGTYTFSLAQGTLPSGLMLNTATGVISGLPSATGTYSFTVKAQTANGCSATQVFSLAINCPALMLMPATLPGGTVGTAYNQTITVSPSGGIYSFAVTSGVLPAGLSLNSATGVLSGTPTATGSFTFTVRATGLGSCTGSGSYTVVIGGGGCPAITLPATLPPGSVGQLYSNSVAASPSGGYSYTFTGNLPPGVTLYSSLGLLLGYPTANGSYNFTVTATGANNCSASQSYSVVIGAGSLQVVNDFSGDHQSDFVLWRAAQAQWLIVDSATNAAQTMQWGQAGDRVVTGDYDGDGKADLAGFGKDGHWRVRLSGGGTLDEVWGLGSDVPVPGDYDGDGKTDLAVWRGAESGWYIQRSSDGQTETARWGTSLAPYLDIPIPGDYDGDGKTDVAVFRQANGHWYIRRSSDGQTVDKAWGLGTDVPVPGDYDGDGLTDIAVWRGSEGDWHIVRSSDGAVESKFWGAAYEPYFDVPAVGDYDGDGKADVAVWRKSDAHWYVQYSSDGTTRTVTQGRSGDQPVTATPRR